MNTFKLRFIITAVLFAMSLISGIAVTRSGRPLNPVPFNIHKIIAVVLIIVAIVVTRQFFKSGYSAATLEIATLVLTGVCLLLLVITGGLLSFEKALPQIVLRIHQIAPVLSLLSASAAVLFLARRIA